jgi:hypothetical protein
MWNTKVVFKTPIGCLSLPEHHWFNILDWRLHPRSGQPPWTSGNSRCIIVAVRRLRVHIWGVRQKNHPLGMSFFRIFISCSAYNVQIQDAEGNFRDSWGETAIRVTDLTVTPDLARVVAVGIHYRPPSPSVGALSPDSRPTDTSTSSSGGGNGSTTSTSRKSENCMIVYDLATKQTVLFVSSLGIVDSY